MAEQVNILINKCKKDDPRAQYELFNLYLPYVNVLVRRYLFDQENVKDIVQEVFITVFKSLKSSFDPNKGNFKPWLRMITINRCIKQNKNNRQYEQLNLEDHETGIEPAVFNTFSEEDMLRFLADMPEAYRPVFNMHAIDGYPHNEIATILDISEASSRKKMSRARKWLDKRLQSSKSFFNAS